MFVKLLNEFTYGSKLNEIRKQFLNGLFSIVERGFWESLTAQEKKMLITCDVNKLSMSELEVNITFEYGYNGKSPQRQMMLEIILEFSYEIQQKLFKFITGCERLPIGGLAALQPRISVAKRIVDENQTPDQTLPSAATCTNFFKLPAYSSKRIMKERVILAIMEGQEGFLLS
jgi:E3 ubiquitin-protein ligase TRIP12